MASKKLSGGNRSDAPPLPFDVTQEIDPALVEDLRPASRAHADADRLRRNHARAARET
jgi:hypothetical protein